MDFKDQVKILGDRVAKMKDVILTEEATKNAFIMPFLQCLGYDIFNPLEVVPEFIADLGIKKGEKVDYAVLKDGSPVILIECKHWSADLDPHNSQLFRYFHTTKAKFGILTNGIFFRFYTDLMTPNKMDEKPFFEFRIDDLKDVQIDKLKEFHKSYFKLETVTTLASELKYMSEIRALLIREISEPSDDFTEFFAKAVYPNRVTAKVLEYFKALVKKTLQQYLNDSINDRLKTALATEQEKADQIIKQQAAQSVEEESKVKTTEEELEGFLIVKAIVCSKIKASRVYYRDSQSYFAIILDDNNRKPICRLNYNGKKKILTYFENGNETKVEIENNNSLYEHSSKLIGVIDYYEKGQSEKN